MTLAEKILAAHSGMKRVRAGQSLDVSVDLAFAHNGVGSETP